MKTSRITELVRIEVLESTTDEQLSSTADTINSFLQKQDGFIDAELTKAFEGNIWYLIYHIENMEKLKAVGEKLRRKKLFDKIASLIVPGSLSVRFHEQVRNW